jgi:hypothetical protein
MGVSVSGLDDVARYIDNEAKRMIDVFLDDLDYVGLQVVKYIRNRSAEESWMDQTGNLRSSIGYVVVRNGVIVKKGGFEKVDGPKREEAKEDGSNIGEGFAERLAERYTKGYALIIVAGMEYASYVEDMDSKDVLKSGELEAERLVTKLVDDYNKMKAR